MNTSAELKARIARLIPAVVAAPSAHNAKIVNEASAQLLALTGEVFVAGQFVKVQ